jgi:integrase
VRLYISPALGPHRLAKLAPQQVQSFINGQMKKGLSPRTAQLSLVILRHALEQATKWGLIGRNVAKLVDSPQVRRFEIKPLNPEQARSLLEAARGERFGALYSVALALGLRQGEALGLRWNDVDLDSRTLSIRQTLERVGGKRFGVPGKLVFVEPKTDRSRRTITMPESIVKALRLDRARQIQERLIAGSRWQDHRLVFSTTIGTPIEPRSVVVDFKRILAKAKLPTTTRFHDLRHSAASLLLAQRVEMRVIMELLGHSTIALTANTYSHVLPNLMHDAAAKMDAILATEG